MDALRKICMKISTKPDGSEEIYSIVNRNTGKEYVMPRDWNREQAKAFFDNYMESEKQKVQRQQAGKSFGMNGKAFDGHFWVERDGKIIDFELKGKSHINEGSVRYHKEAPPAVQRLIIESMYRSFEAKQGFKRDSDEWADYLLHHRNMVGACFHNALREIFLRGGTLKCGSVGFYFKNGNKRTGFECPAGSVWWEYGYGEYEKYTDYFKGSDADIERYWSFEPERDESKY